MASFRGTGQDQSKYKDKDQLLLKQMSFPKIYKTKVSFDKVHIPVFRPWIKQQTEMMLGFEDDILDELIYGLLESKTTPQEMQIQLTGFLEDKTEQFMIRLWELLISAQENKGAQEQLQRERMKDKLEKEGMWALGRRKERSPAPRSRSRSPGRNRSYRRDRSPRRRSPYGRVSSPRRRSPPRYRRSPPPRRASPPRKSFEDRTSASPARSRSPRSRYSRNRSRSPISRDQSRSPIVRQRRERSESTDFRGRSRSPRPIRSPEQDEFQRARERLKL
ncbi:PWI domain-containing protein [Gorgonomyces haynaldii]|nr:PWI domain-containing protein [Gorgonomyces haynaldii]